jgi:hypothetical protein
MTDSTTIMMKGLTVMVGGVTGTTTCDQAAADLSKLASDPANRKAEATFAAEYAKLDPSIQQVLALTPRQEYVGTTRGSSRAGRVGASH